MFRLSQSYYMHICNKTIQRRYPTCLFFYLRPRRGKEWFYSLKDSHGKSEKGRCQSWHHFWPRFCPRCATSEEREEPLDRAAQKEFMNEERKPSWINNLNRQKAGLLFSDFSWGKTKNSMGLCWKPRKSKQERCSQLSHGKWPPPKAGWMQLEMTDAVAWSKSERWGPEAGRGPRCPRDAQRETGTP